MNKNIRSHLSESNGDTPTSAETKTTARRRRWGILVGICLFILVAGIGLWAQPWKDEITSSGPMVSVVRGPMTVSVIESGELESERQKVIANELRWPAIIKEVVPEGTLVKKGQTIIEFECKELIEAIEQEELEVTTAKNNYTQAEQNLQLKKEETENTLLKAKRALKEAKENLILYKEHEHPITLYDKESQVQLAQEDLRLAQKRLDFMLRVNQRKNLESPYSKSEIETNKLKVERLENTLKKARLDLDKLKQYDHKRKLRELQEAIDDTTLALKRTELEAQKQIMMAESNLRANQRHLEMREKRLKELREDEKKLLVKAEEEGLVVYNTGRRQGDVIIAKGEKINPRQQLMIIPDMSTLQVGTRVYEAMIDKVGVALPAIIRLDSKPDESFSGTVSKVAVLPNSQNRWLNPNLKVFDVKVTFDNPPADLKPGMTCKVELILAELESVLSVPVAAVFAEKEKTCCYRSNGEGIEPVNVTIGQMNDRRVEILAGLKEGDVVLLAPPKETLPQPVEEQTPEPTPVAKKEG